MALRPDVVINFGGNTAQLDAAMGRINRGIVGLRSVAATLIGTFSFHAIIEATTRQEEAIAQVEARIKSTGKAAGLSSQQIQRMASEFQDATTFGDEAILEAQSLLLTFTNITGSAFRRATELTLDLSVAMKQDLKSSALQLGKALNDPVAGIAALSRVGVQFTKEQKGQIKALAETNRLAEAQALIMNELQREFGGAAAAARDTLGGALTGLRNTLGDLLEARGGLNDAKQGIEDLTAALKDPAVVDGLNVIVSATVAAVSGLAQLAGLIGTIFSDIRSQLRAMSGYQGMSQEELKRERAAVNDRRAEAVVNVEELTKKIADGAWWLRGELKLWQDILEQEQGNLDLLNAMIEPAKKLNDELERRKKLTEPPGAAAPGPTPGGGKAKGKAAAGGVDYGEERSAILYQFQQGLIDRATYELLSRRNDAAERGLTMGPQQEAALRYQLSAGGFGTETNLTRPESALQSKTITMGPVTEWIGETFRAFFEANAFKIKVAPELVGVNGLERVVQNEADKTGGRP